MSSSSLCDARLAAFNLAWPVLASEEQLNHCLHIASMIRWLLTFEIRQTLCVLQDDVNARLEASESKESAKVPESSNGTNPATTLGEDSGSGLSKLDAGQVADETPVEDKVEAVAGAIGREEEDTSPESTVVSLGCCPWPLNFLSFLF